MTNVIQKIDEEVLRYYTKATRNVPDKRLYKTTLGLSIIGYIVGGVSLIDLKTFLFPISWGTAWAGGANAALSMYGLEGRLSEESEESTRVIPQGIYQAQSLVRKVRLPLLSASIAMTGTSAYNLIRGNDDKDLILLGISGFGYLALASAMYLNDKKPKLLQRDSVLVQAYNKLKEKASSLVPQPQPVPVPIPVRNYGLEDSL